MDNNDFESKILDFLAALQARQTKEVMAFLAPVTKEVAAFAVGLSQLHQYTTASGAAFSDLEKVLRQRGASEEETRKMLVHVRAAQDAFANDIAQGALEATLQHFNDALEVAEKLVK